MLKEIAKSDWREAIIWFLWTTVGGLFPVWVGFIVLHIMDTNPTLSTFSNGGQFALYAASFISTSFYLVSKEYKIQSSSYRRIFVGLGLICVIAICVIFFFATAGHANIIALKEDKLSLLRNGSYLIYCIAALVAFVLTVIDKTRTGKDLRLVEKEDIIKLEKEVKDIGD